MKPDEDFFELTNEEAAELDRRMKHVDEEPASSVEEVFARLVI